MEMSIDPDRIGAEQYEDATGVYVRARNPETGRETSYDIAQLDGDSLSRWMSGSPDRAQQACMTLLGHR